MAYKNALCRLTFNVLEKNLVRRTFSSHSNKVCDLRAAPGLVNNVPLPLLSATIVHNFRAQPKPDLIDPRFLKTPSNILDVPFPLNISHIVDVPAVPLIPAIRPTTPAAIEDPTKVVEQQAARLVVIRRRKMRRHKLKKLRIKMKFVWAKRRQKRELKKEKEFQAELMGKIKEAEKFDAVAYASAKIDKANEVLIPKLWKGKRLPEFVIKDLIVERTQREKAYLEKKERRKNMMIKVSDYKV